MSEFLFALKNWGVVTNRFCSSDCGSFIICCFSCVVTGTCAKSAGMVLSIYHMSWWGIGILWSTHQLLDLITQEAGLVTTSCTRYSWYLLTLWMVECHYISCPLLMHTTWGWWPCQAWPMLHHTSYEPSLPPELCWKDHVVLPNGSNVV